MLFISEMFHHYHRALLFSMLLVSFYSCGSKHWINAEVNADGFKFFETLSVPEVDESHYESSYKPPFILRNAPISVDVMLHSAHFNIESTTTSYLFLMEVTREIIDQKSITGCGVGNFKARNFDVTKDLTIISPDNYLKKSDSDEFEVVLKCRDLPLRMGERGFVEYTFIQDITLAVEAQKPISLNVRSNDTNIKIATCVNANDKNTPWLGEFIRYQKTLGIDHVHVSVFDEYIISGLMFKQVDELEDVKAHVLNGYVTLEMWNNWFDLDAVVPNDFSGLIRKLDCIYQYRYTHDYVFALDSDDFFNFVGEEKDLQSLVLKYCPRSVSKSCSFKSFRYFPGHCGLDENSRRVASGNIIEHLKSKKYEVIEVPKALINTKAIKYKVDMDSSCEKCLASGYGITDVSSDVAYFAKLDVKSKPDGC